MEQKDNTNYKTPVLSYDKNFLNNKFVTLGPEGPIGPLWPSFPFKKRNTNFANHGN